MPSAAMKSAPHQRAPLPTPVPPDDALTQSTCERLFQSGGPRVYVRSADGTLSPQYGTAKSARDMADPGATVWARGRFGGRYVWKRSVPVGQPKRTEAPADVAFTLLDLGRELYASQPASGIGFGPNLAQQIANEVARILTYGCSGGRRVLLDLGNGHKLVCHVEPAA